jgi:hypothetical protein
MIRSDFDPRHYSFERNTRLPRGTFDPPRRRHCILPIVLALALLLVACAALVPN